MSGNIRVGLVDDHAIVREGIRHVLTATHGIEVVGEASNAEDALSMIDEEAPDIVLLDITLPDSSGLELTKRIRERTPELKILVLSMHDDAQYVVAAVRAGVHGYVLKDADAEELRRAVVAVHSGTEYFSSGVINHLGAAVRQEPPPEPAKLARLTAREREVLAGVARGHTNKEIARDLGISPRTVETHRESLMRKIRIKTVAGLTRFAIDTGLLSD